MSSVPVAAPAKPLKIQVLRTATRERQIFPSVAPTTRLDVFQREIGTKFSVPPMVQRLYSGFPPKEIDTSTEQARACTLAEAGIRNGDTIEVREEDPSALDGLSRSPTETVQMQQGRGWEYPPTIDNRGSMNKKAMPADNSCLFHSVAYVCQNKTHGVDAAMRLREVVANLVASDPATYNTSFLGSPNHLYQDSVMNPNVWGGAIELALLATHFQAEIIAFDFHYLREDVFGADCGYKKRVFLLYRGDHYDAIVWQPSSSGSEQVSFSTKDDNAWSAARDMIMSLHQQAVKNGECALQKEWRSGQIRRTNAFTLEQERIRRAKEEKAQRERSMAANQNVMSDEGVPSSRSVSSVMAASASSASSLSSSTSSSSSSTSVVDEDGWSCPACTFFNSFNTIQCSICSSRAPFATEGAAPASSIASPATAASTSLGAALPPSSNNIGFPPRSASPAPPLPVSSPVPFSSSSSSGSAAAAAGASGTIVAMPGSSSSSSNSSMSSSSAASSTSIPSAWVCPSCTYNNSSARSHCEMCDAVDPSRPAPATSSSSSPDIPPDVYDDDGVPAALPQQEDQLIGGPIPYALPTRDMLATIQNSPMALEWNCPRCTMHCPAFTMTCTTCGESNPALEEMLRVHGAVGGRGGAATTAAGGGRAITAQQQQQQQQQQRSRFSRWFGGRSQARWICESCQTDNNPNLVCCKQCRQPNYSLALQHQGGASGGGNGGGGDNCVLM